MVGVFRRSVLAYVRALHQQTLARGLEGQQPRTTLYRWHRTLGKRLHYYPNISFAALGFTHVHAFVRNAGDHWYTFPYAIERAWTTDHPGRHTLYLHCLIPTVTKMDECLAGWRRPGETLTTITTGDGWQSLVDLPRVLDRSGRVLPGATLEHSTPTPWRGTTALPTTYPLAIPVLAELVAERRSLPALWQSIYDRFGPNVWRFIPPRTRRVVHNGKRYARDVLRLLNAEGLVRQHIVRYTPLHEQHLEVLLITNSTTKLRTIAQHAPVLETYPAPNGTQLVRALGDVQLLKAVIASGERWWILEDERTESAPTVRLAYEKVFEPGGWVKP